MIREKDVGISKATTQIFQVPKWILMLQVCCKVQCPGIATTYAQNRIKKVFNRGLCDSAEGLCACVGGA